MRGELRYFVVKFNHVSVADIQTALEYQAVEHEMS